MDSSAPNVLTYQSATLIPLYKRNDAQYSILVKIQLTYLLIRLLWVYLVSFHDHLQLRKVSNQYRFGRKLYTLFGYPNARLRATNVCAGFPERLSPTWLNTPVVVEQLVLVSNDHQLKP